MRKANPWALSLARMSVSISDKRLPRRRTFPPHVTSLKKMDADQKQAEREKGGKGVCDQSEVPLQTESHLRF